MADQQPQAEDAAARLPEKEGVAVLASVFRAHGYDIDVDVPFDEAGVAFSVDGFDAARRVGFEYRTHEADDKEDLTDAEIARLGARIEAGELLLLIVDEVRIPDAATLTDFATRFLEVTGPHPRTFAAGSTSTKKASTKKASTKKASTKKTSTKKASTKTKKASTKQRSAQKGVRR